MDENSIEVKTALKAVLEASMLCRQVQKDLIGEFSFVKSDRSPVTIGDYGSQALICKELKEAFPYDTIVAEEDSTELRDPHHSPILAQVTGYVKAQIPDASPAQVCDWIDSSSRSLTERFWVLDPIDGTRGFLRGDQYAIALALIENGQVILGIMACPNLSVDIREPLGRKGCVFLAIRGKGSVQTELEGQNGRSLSVSKMTDPSNAFFTESVELSHVDRLLHERVARKLNLSNDPIRIDSEAKYGLVARGEAVLYLRIPCEGDYRENIWDHASGAIIVEEAGGKVSDALGRPLDFYSGIRMTNNYGIVVTNGIIHDRVLEALRQDSTQSS